MFGAQARFAGDKVTISGQSRVYMRTADSRNKIDFHFCVKCGATAYYHPHGDINVIVVSVGAFADPEFPPPRASVYDSCRHSWAIMPSDIEHID